LEDLKRKEITQSTASSMLKLCERQIGRIFKRYLEAGAKGLVHKNRAKENPRKTPVKLREQIIELIKTNYPDFGPVLATEMLEERHKITISRETVRKIMLESGVYKKKRKGAKHRRWRAPKERRGEMYQLDGSFHYWFEKRAPRCWLIRFTDDATGELIHAEFATAESYNAVAVATIASFKKHGLPQSIYTDKGKVFHVNNHNEDGERTTQYERALGELGIELIHAHSPQAKGRVERNFKTDQDRLVKMLRINNIDDIEAANQYIQDTYLPKYNSKFSRPALYKADAHRKLGKANLDDVFCILDTRTVRNDWTFQYKGRTFQIENQRPAIVKPRDSVAIYERLDGSIFIKKDSKFLIFTEIKQKAKQQYQRKINVSYKFGKTSSWRRSNSIFYDKKGHFHSAKKPDIITLP
jgi:hypothetical protein